MSGILLLGRYETTEKRFGGSIEARVLKLREEHRDNLDKVAAALILSHLRASLYLPYSTNRRQVEPP